MSKRGENIYRRKDGRWEGRCLCEAAQNGERKYVSVYGRTYREAQQKLRRRRASLAESPAAAGNSIAVQAESWLLHRRPYIKESTYVHYACIVQRHIVPYLGTLRPDELTPAELQHYTDLLLQSGGKCGSGLSPKSVSDILCVLKSILRFATAQSGASAAVLPRLELHCPVHRIRVFTEQEQRQLVEVLRAGDTERDWGILLSLFTGVRLGELCALTWGDFDLDAGILHIDKTMQRLPRQAAAPGESRTYLTVTPPKSASSIRDIPLLDFLCVALRKRQKDKSCFFLACRPGMQIEPRNMQCYFKRVLRRAQIADANFHALRHTFATRCVEAGCDAKSLSEILGHADVKITLDRYVHPSMALKRSNLQRLAAFLPVDCPED